MPPTFRQAAAKALLDDNLQIALQKSRSGFVEKRQQAIDELPEFEQIKQRAAKIKQHTLDHLGDYLKQFEDKVEESGGRVHWAQTTEQANHIVLDICRHAKAKKISKGKSMVSEEMGLNDILIEAGMDVVETDLGEYIVQLANEKPSHIIAPAVHKTRAQIEALFDHFHQDKLPENRSREDLVAEARSRLRVAFESADVGITGANFLIAETGSTVLVTNEGNGDLTSSIPKVHIVTTSIEKVIPKLNDLPTFLRLLGRSATGQEITAYTSLFTGPKREKESQGPKEFHVVLLDNGRSKIHGSEFKPVLNCIRCGACLNHCAVYNVVGGHTFGGVYPGPIGQVISPLLNDQNLNQGALSACTLNGHCKAVCPMSIPLPELILKHRQLAYENKELSTNERILLRLWTFIAKKHKTYRLFVKLSSLSLSTLVKSPRWLARLLGLGRWLENRNLIGGKRHD